MRWHTNFFACIRFSRRCAVARRFAAAMGSQTIFLLAFLASMALLAAADDTVETTADAGAAGEPTERVPGFTKAFGESFMVILATEIGDRTFFIAAIMAMRHSRFIIWSGAVGALVVMTVLSTLVGHVAPLLIPRSYTQLAAAGLFAFFGVRMLKDGMAAEDGASEELEEVEQELNKKQDDPQADDEEAGEKTPALTQKEADAASNKILMQAFTLTFLAEWGDRSQIATIALAAAREPFGVTLGGCIGHACCTAMAVVGGKLLASSISERKVLLAGGVCFVVFAVLALFGIGD